MTGHKTMTYKQCLKYKLKVTTKLSPKVTKITEISTVFPLRYLSYLLTDSFHTWKSENLFIVSCVIS